MKRHKNSSGHKAEVVKIEGQSWKFSSWLWPYLVIPSCVAALIALFFFVIIPPLRHGIGHFGVGFWLSAFAIWIIITIVCTMLWIFAGQHLLKTDYNLISYIKTEEHADHIGVIENSHAEGIINYEIESKDKKQCQFVIEEKVRKYHTSDEQNGDQTSNFSEQSFLQPEKHVLHEKFEQSIQPSSADQLNIPECHPPRRVSYAGVVSVEIPNTEELADEDEQRSDSKLRVPRPPTPRFPRGMRVLSAEKCSAKYTEVSVHQEQPNASSEPQTTTEIFQFEEKKVLEPRISGEIEHVVIGKVSSSSMHLGDKKFPEVQQNGLDKEGNKDTLNNYTISSEQRGRVVSDVVDFKKRNFSIERQRSTSIDRNKRMSMDRNQFLGWNPEEGILAEADPGSKEREEMRWRKSLGQWHHSISASCNEDSKPEEGIDDDDELDDVFQDKN